MSDERNYQEIEFLETDTETIESNIIAAYEHITKRTLYPADPVRIFIGWLADIVIQQRILINESAKQNLLRYATGDYLDALSEMFKDVSRLEAQPARTTFRFYISEAQEQSVIIKEGTRITVDGDILFSTEEALEIKAGEVHGDVKGVCSIAGTVGNGFTPGQIKEIVDVYSYYFKVENITESSGGAEGEDDNSFYERIRNSQDSYSTAGPTGAYIYHAKSASPLITDVSPTSPSPGVVDIRILLKDSVLPDQEMLDLVYETLNSDKVRPLTEEVIVSAPELVDYAIDLTYYIPRPSFNSALIVESDVEEAISEYIAWQSEKMGRDINPSKLTSLLMAKGVKRVDIKKPLYKAVEKTHVAYLINRNVTNGGIEDE